MKRMTRWHIHSAISIFVCCIMCCCSLQRESDIHVSGIRLSSSQYLSTAQEHIATLSTVMVSPIGLRTNDQNEWMNGNSITYDFALRGDPSNVVRVAEALRYALALYPESWLEMRNARTRKQVALGMRPYKSHGPEPWYNLGVIHSIDQFYTEDANGDGVMALATVYLSTHHRLKDGYYEVRMIGDGPKAQGTTEPVATRNEWVQVPARSVVLE